MNTLSLDNGSLQYSLSGKPSAPVLILSNSLGTDLDMWVAQDSLTAQFQVLRYDTRGHGLSRNTLAAFGLEQLGRDVLALMDHLDIDQAAFCGISMGGITGQWLGVYAPERFTHLILANTAARIGTEAGWLSRAQAVREQGMGPIAAGAAQRWFTESFIAQNPDIVKLWTQRLAAADAQGYAACCEALATADLRDQIHKILVPTLVIAGTDDPVTTPRDADDIAKAISNAERCDLPASHLSNIEAFTLFNEAVIRFLK